MNPADITAETQVLATAGMTWMPVEGKKAFIKKWHLLSQAELAKERNNSHNIGVKTGKASNCFVVDIDVKKRGLEVWNRLEEKMGKIDTYRVITGTGGLHIYFDYTGTQGIGNKVECVKQSGVKIGIDTRNDNGYVVAPPSLHPDSEKLYLAEVPLRQWLRKRGDKPNFEPLPDWLRSLLVGDAEVDKDYNIVAVKKEEEKDDKEYAKVCTRGITLEWVTALVNLLKSERSDDHEDWRTVVFALHHTSERYKLKLKPLAHEFSKKSEKYEKKDGKKAVNALWKEEPTDKTPVAIWSIAKMAKEDNLEKWTELRKTIEYSGDATPTFWQDLPTIRASKPTFAEMVLFFRGCLFEVTGVTTTFFKRMRNGSIEASPQPFVARGDDMEIELEKGQMRLSEILEATRQHPDWSKKNCFDRVDCLPWFGNHVRESPGVLNTFCGFPIQPIEGTSDDMEKCEYHIKEILCAGHAGMYQLFTNWMAHFVQKPGQKIDIVIFFLGLQGTGKSLFIDKLFELLCTKKYYHEVDDMDALFERFNDDSKEKMICVLNEVGTYKDGQSGKLKSAVTRKVKKVELKFGARFEVSDIQNFMGLTNKKHPTKIEISNRRYALQTVSPAKIGDKQYFIDLDKALNADTVGRLLHKWLNVDLTGWKKEIPQTAALLASRDMSLPQEIRFLIDVAALQTTLMATVDARLRIHTESLFSAYTSWCRNNGEVPLPSKVFSSEVYHTLGITTPKNVQIDGERRKGINVTMVELRTALRKTLRDDNYVFDLVNDDEEEQPATNDDAKDLDDFIQ